MSGVSSSTARRFARKAGDPVSVGEVVHNTLTDTVRFRANGGVQTLGGGDDDGFQRYVATLSQTDINPPVAVVLQNSLSGEPTYGRHFSGSYTLVLTGAFVDPDSVWLYPHPLDLGVSLAVVDDDTVSITVSGGDDSLNHFPIEIRIYPATLDLPPPHP
jgi:hypothetical protein